ncbi:MAG: hypothetical protein KAT04_13890, partial [Methylococcales bacterium]|nr:hypothetical protein [Methylococcales bacterium]
MINKTKIALGVAASLALAGALVSPQALAQTQAEKTAALEAQVNQMSSMMQEMQAELSRVKTVAADAASTSKVQELDQWMASVRNAPAQASAKDHQISFRGGWMHFNDNRNGTGTLGNTGTALNNLASDKDAFYYGGAIDFNVNNDLFGMMDDVSFGMELGLEYAHLGNRRVNGLGIVHGTGNQTLADVNQLRISISPKLKFMHGSKLRPWLIPIGFDINIISPPSSAITVLNTGMQFGAGV